MAYMPADFCVCIEQTDKRTKAGAYSSMQHAPYFRGFDVRRTLLLAWNVGPFLVHYYNQLRRPFSTLDEE